MALFELASEFACSDIIACVRRSQEATDFELVRSLGWCGFSLTTLGPWWPGNPVSTEWLFLKSEV